MVPRLKSLFSSSVKTGAFGPNGAASRDARVCLPLRKSPSMGALRPSQPTLRACRKDVSRAFHVASCFHTKGWPAAPWAITGSGVGMQSRAKRTTTASTIPAEIFLFLMTTCLLSSESVQGTVICCSISDFPGTLNRLLSQAPGWVFSFFEKKPLIATAGVFW